MGAGRRSGEFGVIFKRWHPDMDIGVKGMPVTA